MLGRGEGVASRLLENGEERNREAREGFAAFCLRLNEILGLLASH